MRFFLGSDASELEKCKTKEIEELGTENMFGLGLGVLCVAWRQCDQKVSKWRSLLHIYLTPLGSLNSSPRRRDHEKAILNLTRLQHLLVYWCSDWKRAGQNLIASI